MVHEADLDGDGVRGAQWHFLKDDLDIWVGGLEHVIMVVVIDIHDRYLGG